MTSSPNSPPDPSQDGSGNPSAKPLPGAFAFLGMGSSVAGCVAVGLFLGIWLDGLTHTSPLFLVVGLVLGLAAAVGTVVAQVRRFL